MTLCRRITGAPFSLLSVLLQSQGEELGGYRECGFVCCGEREGGRGGNEAVVVEWLGNSANMPVAKASQGFESCRQRCSLGEALNPRLLQGETGPDDDCKWLWIKASAKCLIKHTKTEFYFLGGVKEERRSTSWARSKGRGSLLPGRGQRGVAVCGNSEWTED